MTLTEIGMVYNFMLQHKIVRSYDERGTRKSKEEKEVSDILERHNQRLDDLNEFLATQGLKLQVLGAQEYGLNARGGHAYVLTRSLTSGEAPEHLNTSHVWSRFKNTRKAENKQATVIWTSYLYLQLFYFLYTLDNRTIESVSRFKDTYVDYEVYREHVINAIEELRRNSNSAEYSETQIRQVLSDATETEIDGRIVRFFNTLVLVGVLERTGDMSFNMLNASPRIFYRQTLWSAVDVAENFKRYGSLLLNPPAPDSVYKLSKENE